MQRRDVSVETAAHILQVKKQNVNILQLFGSRFLIFTVKGDHSQSSKRILAGSDGRAGLRLSAEAMLRTEKLHQIDFARQQRIDQMSSTHHGGLVTAQRDAFAL